MTTRVRTAREHLHIMQRRLDDERDQFSRYLKTLTKLQGSDRLALSPAQANAIMRKEQNLQQRQRRIHQYELDINTLPRGEDLYKCPRCTYGVWGEPGGLCARCRWPR